MDPGASFNQVDTVTFSNTISYAEGDYAVTLSVWPNAVTDKSVAAATIDFPIKVVNCAQSSVAVTGTASYTAESLNV